MTSVSGPLAGLLVVGLEHSVAGPLCTRILGDLGAEVVKVERPPGGDFARHWDTNVHGDCSQFWWLNRRKKSVALDLKTAAGRAAFDALLGRADVLVSNQSPRAMDGLGLTREVLAAEHPTLVACSISGYGEHGAFRERKAYDMLVQAESGVMSLTGSEDQPARVGVSISDVSTGIYAAALVLGAVVGRLRHERGAYLDVAMFDATVEFAGPMLISYLNAGIVYPRSADRHHAIAPYGVFRCAGGDRVLVAVHNDAEWRRVADRLLGRPELADDPRYATSVARLEHRDEVDALTAAALGALSTAEATALLDEIRVAYGSFNDMGGVAEHPAATDRSLVDEVATADGAVARTLVGMGERLFSTSAGDRLRPPLLGEDTEAVLASLEIVSEPS
jgi:crotonobetainyl-CoA:carnitine CoA-transferase CaiB-like acyl-CoA transferase